MKIGQEIRDAQILTLKMRSVSFVSTVLNCTETKANVTSDKVKGIVNTPDTPDEGATFDHSRYEEDYESMRLQTSRAQVIKTT